MPFYFLFSKPFNWSICYLMAQSLFEALKAWTKSYNHVSPENEGKDGSWKPPPQRKVNMEDISSSSVNEPDTIQQHTHTHSFRACWGNYAQLSVREERCGTGMASVLLRLKCLNSFSPAIQSSIIKTSINECRSLLIEIKDYRKHIIVGGL